MIKPIEFDGFNWCTNGVCAPKGFKAAGIICGIKKSNTTKRDLAVIFSEVPCAAAACYTQNKVKGAPIAVTKKHLRDNKAQAVIVNSGNANTCNADGEEKAVLMCELAGKALSLDPNDVIVASTGVIGQILPIEPIENKIDELVSLLSVQGATDAAEAIMTTDTFKKELAVSFTLGGVDCKIGAMAKGSGMIHPNMATMLSFMTTDVAIDPELLQKALSRVVPDTFNMVSVDGDTSTNDTVAIMASGLAKNKMLDDVDSEDFATFVNAMYVVLMNISRALASDGEGATKLLECTVTGAIDEENAKIVAKGVITSTLFKCAMFGKDANWGRILCAIGYSNATLDINKVDVDLASTVGRIAVCKNGAGLDFDEELAAAILAPEEIKIIINLGDANGKAVAWGCDLTYDYVKINGDYRT